VSAATPGAQQLDRDRPGQHDVRSAPDVAELTGRDLLIEPVPVIEQESGTGIPHEAAITREAGFQPAGARNPQVGPLAH